MKRPTLNILFTTFAAALALALAPACGGDDDGGGDGEESSSSSSGSSSQCSSSYDCVGTSCECTAGSKQGQSCCHPDDCGSDSNNCQDVCEICS
jgi:hypothetical protein